MLTRGAHLLISCSAPCAMGTRTRTLKFASVTSATLERTVSSPFRLTVCPMAKDAHACRERGRCGKWEMWKLALTRISLLLYIPIPDRRQMHSMRLSRYVSLSISPETSLISFFATAGVTPC